LLNGGETPSAHGKGRLLLVVPTSADDLSLVDPDAGEIDGSSRGRTHAMGCPIREIGVFA
jgi:hypothetical protein